MGVEKTDWAVVGNIWSLEEMYARRSTAYKITSVSLDELKYFTKIVQASSLLVSSLEIELAIDAQEIREELFIKCRRFSSPTGYGGLAIKRAKMTIL